MLLKCFPASSSPVRQASFAGAMEFHSNPNRIHNRWLFRRIHEGIPAKSESLYLTVRVDDGPVLFVLFFAFSKNASSWCQIWTHFVSTRTMSLVDIFRFRLAGKRRQKEVLMTSPQADVACLDHTGCLSLLSLRLSLLSFLSHFYLKLLKKGQGPKNVHEQVRTRKGGQWLYF